MNTRLNELRSFLAGEMRKDVSDIAGIDPEVIDLCNALNNIVGVRTYESCCGHGKEPFRVWFRVKSLKPLPKIAYWCNPCHCSAGMWQLIATTDCAMSPIRFRIESKDVGEVAYRQAADMAQRINGMLRGEMEE